jgi:threonine dehydrogenase-like Zn-dependent dehydrogenase
VPARIMDGADNVSGRSSHVVQFVSPGKVSVAWLPPEGSAQLGPKDVLVRTMVTAVSSGTELLVYRGQMPDDVPTDAVLGGQSGEQAVKPFTYPSSYGYANVGRVIAVGKDVLGGRICPGTIVFAFREHASWYVAPVEDVSVVPDGVDPVDAVFMPNVETAVSLVMDAAPLPGDNVAVVGQGIVGMLVVAVLKLCYGKAHVVAIDVNKDRLAVSKTSARPDATISGYDVQTKLGEVLLPGDTEGVDVSIDVSGSSSGFDTAIQITRDGGRVIIGSWFGSKTVQLRQLGGRFHRSHISIVASQVSSLPPWLTPRWDKARRFRLVWKILQEVAPSQRFPLKVFHVLCAADAYSEIDQGHVLQVLFKYHSDDGTSVLQTSKRLFTDI